MPVTSITSAFSVSGNVTADDKHDFIFKPMDSSARTESCNIAAPWKPPRGFTQAIVSDETSLNIYHDGGNHWHEMNMVNETGLKAWLSEILSKRM